MRIATVFFLSLIFFFSCIDAKGPDVSKIHVDASLIRFEQDIFSADTTAIGKTINDVKDRLPELSSIFLNNILGLDSNSEDEGLKRFISQTQPIYDSTKIIFGNFENIKEDFESSLRYVKYYFPEYKLPILVTILGPLDAFARTSTGELTTNFLTKDYLGIFLQFYLGRNFSLYNDVFYITNIAPQFRSRRFDKEYIVADGMKRIVDDIYPDKSSGKGLIEQMIEKGKQWWLLDKFLPGINDSLKTGFTNQQLNWCGEYEGMIWNDIITTQKDLYSKDPMAVQNYLGEAPFTQSLGPSSPGNIGQWIGWQIVKKFADKNSSMNVADVLKTEARKILEESKYKPK